MQNGFLDDLVKSQATVHCFLVNGIKLEGVVSGYDQFSLLLSSEHSGGSTQLIMKNAISTVVPKTNTPHFRN